MNKCLHLSVNDKKFKGFLMIPKEEHNLCCPHCFGEKPTIKRISWKLAADNGCTWLVGEEVYTCHNTDCEFWGEVIHLKGFTFYIERDCNIRLT